MTIQGTAIRHVSDPQAAAPQSYTVTPSVRRPADARDSDRTAKDTRLLALILSVAAIGGCGGPATTTGQLAVPQTRVGDALVVATGNEAAFDSLFIGSRSQVQVAQ
jgi:hypothetical protein